MLQALINFFKPYKKEETTTASSDPVQETLPLVKLGPEPLPETIPTVATSAPVAVAETKQKKKPAVIKAKPKTTATKNTRKKK